jgi:Ribbon-helix-helix protein, copG family
MTHFRETDDKEATVGFRLPQYVVELIDILCRSEDLNRSQFLRRALDAYEPMRDAIGEFDREIQGVLSDP